MSEASSLTAQRLRQLVDYDLSTGIFRWRECRSRAWIGKAAGFSNKDGHIQLRIDGRKYYAHRLAWLYVHGEWPIHQIDHRDTDPTNNAIANLRAATNRQNRQNVRSKRADGRKGIHFTQGQWQAAIRVDGKRMYLGRYGTPDAAAQAYAIAAAKHHGEFARVG